MYCVPPHTRPAQRRNSRLDRATRHLHSVYRVFVDDYMNGVAGPPGRKRKHQELEGVARGALHAIHAIFPPPDVLQQDGGRDSISEKKLLKGGASWEAQRNSVGFRCLRFVRNRQNLFHATGQEGQVFKLQTASVQHWPNRDTLSARDTSKRFTVSCNKRRSPCRV
jgi:hypothetical protein